jgi:hypothetical protein
MTAEPTTSACGPYGQVALDLFDRGLIPVPLNGKVPAVMGFQRSQIHRSVVEKFCSKFGHFNVGVVTGLGSGVTVIDLDGPDAISEAMAFETPIVIGTPSGGAHAWFASNEEPCANLRSKGIQADVKGRGGVVAVPPSIRADGNSYRFLRGSWSDLRQLSPIPKEFRNLLGRQAVATVAPVSIGCLVAICKGQRNQTLFKQLLLAAPQMADHAELLKHAHDLNQRLSPPLGDAEIARTATSVWGYQERGENFAGRGRRAIVDENEIDQLAQYSPALVLLCFLRVNHPSNHTFAISPAGIGERLGWGPRKVAKARDHLVRLGIVQCLHSGGKREGDSSRFKFSP